jgi:putative methyltransferase (TIGR04325 family)
MGMREIVTAVCSTVPFRSLAGALSRRTGGRRFLTRLSPRRGIYGSFDEAWTVARNGRHPGHEHPEAVERHVVLAAKPMPSDYAVLYWLNRIRGDIRLFDFGGNMGNVYYSCARYIDTADRSLQWTVYDFPFIIDMARKIAASQAEPIPHFTTALQDSSDANVLLISGTYHYWEKDTAAFLDQFPRLPEHVLINRSPFYDDNRAAIVSMQATLNFAFPIIVRNVSEVVAGFVEKGYELVDRWTAAEYSHSMPFFPDLSVPSYSGFYFRRKTS